MSDGMEQKNSCIMIVEDNPEDFETTLRAFRKSGVANKIVHCEDGDDALDYLYQRGDHADPETSPRPTVILLDLNLPGTDGREVLHDIKDNDSLKTIPVIVLTTSTDERDIEDCYSSGANSYMQKPVNLDGFMEAIQRLRDFWFKVVVLPKPQDG
ncbi:MAG: response regulator [Rhodospirillaceae bacterium]|jgi:CheY-like chemotaxis protein|nr:response regulator [Rhodospirillales bacterium]MBT3905687.1 response regulator [Rhodospirillaceae bacterium]MBT4699962.1 response regulator [Rhodospirillaceae bacterium]MBT5034320.1 response regulator [Rhodospirillaceae bacterium]MBT6221716.1 response regulator [Rhodospirillaceae bacterium]